LVSELEHVYSLACGAIGNFFSLADER
jgi:hypothetical protein